MDSRQGVVQMHCQLVERVLIIPMQSCSSREPRCQDRAKTNFNLKRIWVSFFPLKKRDEHPILGHNMWSTHFAFWEPTAALASRCEGFRFAAGPRILRDGRLRSETGA